MSGSREGRDNIDWGEACRTREGYRAGVSATLVKTSLIICHTVAVGSEGTEGVEGRVTGSFQSFILAHLHGRRCVPDFLDSGGSQRDVEAGYDGCVISPGSSSIISTTQLALLPKEMA